MSNLMLAERLFMDTAHCDVVFVVENEEIPGHRDAFATSCAYFDKLLYGDFKESKSVKVEIPETSAKVFKEIKRYIYLGELVTADWKIEDQLGLLSLAHEYHYQELFAEVMKALEAQELDLNSWNLVNSAAAIYGSASLKAKCVAFAGAEVDNFLGLKNIEKLSKELVRCMFNTPKISAVNQDQLLCSLLQWKKIHSSAQIMSVFQKISWDEVSQNIAASIAKVLLLNLKNCDEIRIWDQLVDEIHVQSQWILKVDNVVLSWGKELRLPLGKCDLNASLSYFKKYLQISFKKNDSFKEIPVKRIEFELSNQHQIQKISGSGIQSLLKIMDFKILNASNNCLKYSAIFSEVETVCYINFYSDRFNESSEIILRSLVIY